MLEVIYSSLQALDYECDSSTKYSIPEYCNMLLFADAVGCSKGFIHKVASLLGPVVPPEFCITVTEQLHRNTGQDTSGSTAGMQEQVVASSSSLTAVPTTTRAVVINLDSFYELYGVPGCKLVGKSNGSNTEQPLTEQQLKTVQQQLIPQLELMLYVALKLDLPNLYGRMSRFLRSNDGSNLLPNKLLDPGPMSASSVQPSSSQTAADTAAQSSNPVLSRRVLAAANSSNLGREALARACLQQPLGLGFGDYSLLENLCGLPEDMEGRGVLLHDLLHFKAGSRIRVNFSNSGLCCIKKEGDDFHHVTHFGIVLGRSRKYFENAPSP